MPVSDVRGESGSALHLLSASLIMAPLLVWEVRAAATGVNAIFFPPPSAWFRALQTLWVAGTLPTDLIATSMRFSVGMTLGAVSGWVVGLLLGSAPRLRAVLDPIVAVFHPLPKISLYPLLLLLLGFGEAPKIAIVAIATFFPLFVNTLQGVREVDRTLVDVVRTFGGRRLMVLKRVVLPGSLPFVLAGLRLAMNTGLTVTVAVELLTAGDGLGSRIWFAWQRLRVDELFAVLLVIGAFGLIVNTMLERLFRLLMPSRSER